MTRIGAFLAAMSSRLFRPCLSAKAFETISCIGAQVYMTATARSPSTLARKGGLPWMASLASASWTSPIWHFLRMMRPTLAKPPPDVW